MPQIEQVMTASEFSPEKHLPLLPLYATPKVDGVRFYVKSGRVYTRSNKPLPNKKLRLLLPTILPDGADGELCGSLPSEENAFQKAQSVAMGVHANISGVHLYLFDWLDPTYDVAPHYSERIAALDKWWKTRLQVTLAEQFVHYKSDEHNLRFVSQMASELALKGGIKELLDTLQMLRSRVTILTPTALRSPSHPDKFLATCLSQGYEGIMLRKPSGGYKFGRSTEDEALLLKYKPWADAEAVVIGFEELMHNDNPEFVSETGKTRRSTSEAGLRAGKTLGAFRVRDCITGVQFTIGGGKGLTTLFRREVWENQAAYLGRTITFRFLKTGTKDLPRMPQFIGFRNTADL